ncbi:protein of unknown function [Nitrospira japonica]|uniref:Uncharacterized protein n=1 Tax=Nitrospira japonica TaxID=1325564 RepID=A0A1W1I4L1_9BACT|nr:protein of unknown function [Nitrospira japonica]
MRRTSRSSTKPVASCSPINPSRPPPRNPTSTALVANTTIINHTHGVADDPAAPVKRTTEMGPSHDGNRFMRESWYSTRRRRRWGSQLIR